MAGILKLKIFIGLLAVVLLTVVALYENHFYRENTKHKWQVLNWEHFNGVPKPFTRYGAGISGSIDVKVDSISGMLRAYAVMNSAWSWVRPDNKGNDYTLNHEQYHFNLTEYYARLLNLRLAEGGLSRAKDVDEGLVEDIKYQMDSKQALYDGESDHGMILNRQRLWEYKIDSLLASTDSLGGFSTDYYTGAQVFFPDTPDSIFKVDSDNRIHSKRSVDDYDMNLFIETVDFPAADTTNFIQYVANIYGPLQVVRAEYKGDMYCMEFLTETVNSSGTMINLDRWVWSNDILYRVHAGNYGGDEDKAGYRSIGESFLGSFRIVDTDSYWRQYDIIKMPDQDGDDAKVRDNLKGYLMGPEPKVYGLIGKPVVKEGESVFFPFMPVVHESSQIHKAVAIMNDQLMTTTTNSGKYLYFFPAEVLLKADPSDKIKYGYTLKSDSGEEYRNFYYQEITVGELFAPVNDCIDTRWAPL